METQNRLTITAEELAVALGVSTDTIYERRKSGDLTVPEIAVGRRYVWSRARVAAVLGADPLTGEPVAVLAEVQSA